MQQPFDYSQPQPAHYTMPVYDTAAPPWPAQSFQHAAAPTAQHQPQVYTQLVNGQAVRYQLMPAPSPAYAMPQQPTFAAHPMPAHAQPLPYNQLSMSAPPSQGYPYAMQTSTPIYQQHPTSQPMQPPPSQQMHPPPTPSYDLQRQPSVTPASFEPSRSLSIAPAQPSQSIFGPPQPAEQTEIFSPLYTTADGASKTESAVPATSQSARQPLPPQRGLHDGSSARGRRGGRQGQRGGRSNGSGARRTEIVARDDTERANKEVRTL